MPLAITRATDKPAEGNEEVLSEQGEGDRYAPWRSGNNWTPEEKDYSRFNQPPVQHDFTDKNYA